ncbi:MAG: chlorosome protein C [Rhizobacter sp.]|nr:chlorosome protein C [Chlorobiales bacterium]
MTESYEKLRNEFKDMPLTDRVAFLAEAAFITGQSAIVGTMNLIGDVVERTAASADDIAKATGLSGMTSEGVSQTVNRVVITVKDAGRTASEVVKDAARSVDSITVDAARGVGDMAAKATDVVKDVADSVSRAASNAADKIDDIR